MKRSQIILGGLVVVLATALFWFLLYQPQREALAEVEQQIEAQVVQQQQLATEIARLRAVREEAPEVEAELAAVEAIVPRDPAIPAALRQLQLAADESGLVLRSVTTGRPTAVDGPDGLNSISVGMQLSGGYFQVVDFLRRLEDPAISPRGFTWTSVTAAPDVYPSLQVSITGQAYTVLETPAPEPAEAPEGADAPEGAELDADAGEPEGTDDGTTPDPADDGADGEDLL